MIGNRRFTCPNCRQHSWFPASVRMISVVVILVFALAAVIGTKIIVDRFSILYGSLVFIPMLIAAALGTTPIIRKLTRDSADHLIR